MAETLTEVDTFDATIQWPSANELASAADVRDKAIQRLTNRTRNHKNRLDGHDTDISAVETDVTALEASAATKVTAGAATFGITTSTAYAIDDVMGLAVVRADTGYSVTGGNTIHVTAKGWYLLTVILRVTMDSTSSAPTAGVRVDVGGTDQMTLRCQRFDVSAALGVTLSGSVPIWIETPGTDTIQLISKQSVGNQTVTSPDRARVGLARIGAPA